MYVKNHMLPKEELVTLQTNETLKSALEKMNKGDFLSLPVFEDEVFCGTLMKEAIFRKYFEEGYTDKKKYLNEVKVVDTYNKQFKTIYQHENIENASYLLNHVKKPFLSVIDDEGNFVGIITHNAIFNAFTEIFGLKNGTRIEVEVYDIPGQIAKLTQIIRREKVNIVNFAIFDAKVMDVYKVIIRVDNSNVDDLEDKLQKAGFKVVKIEKY